MIKIGIETMGHFIRLYKEKTNTYIKNFIEYIDAKLKDGSFYPELKSTLFLGLGDTSYGNPEIFIQVVPNVLNIYTMGYQACKMYLSSVRALNLRVKFLTLAREKKNQNPMVSHSETPWLKV